MEDLSLHILDIVENGTAAGATRVEIAVRQDSDRDEFRITIQDNGRGMDREILARVCDPFTTTRTTRRVGMGMALLEQACRQAEGHLHVTSSPGQGTEVVATFRANHIDRKPLADIGSTLVTLITGHPDVDFRYESDIDGKETVVDTREIKAELEEVPITDPQVLALIRGQFDDDG
jgi:hypothetical protein